MPLDAPQVPSPALELRSDVTGHTAVHLTTLAGRQVVLIDATDRAEHDAGEPAADEPMATAASASTTRGALRPEDGEQMAAGFELALSKRIPAVMLLASSGADANFGVAALHGWGTAARALVRCSGVVPTVVGVTGPAVSGPALLLGLADVVVMSEESYAFVSGPVPVRQMTGVAISPEELGGAQVHEAATGAADFVVPDDDVLPTITAVLACLPNHAEALPPAVPTADPSNRPTPEAADFLPATATGGYDVRDVVATLCDDGELLELRAGWAPNLVTAFASVGGHRIGVVANQPTALAGTLDIAASQKGAGFVALCDSFNIPLVTFVDTPGFYPGKDLEWRGMIRHGAQLAFAYARATVPRICVVLRKSYGGAYIVMDSKTMGNDVCMAWPSAELAVMGANQAAQILRRDASEEEVADYIAHYEATYLNPYVAAERGYVDLVVSPDETRRHLAEVLDLLATKREKLPRRRHDNSPL